MNIPVRVRNLIKKHGTNNPYTLCMYLNINVLFCELGDIKGYYKKCLRKKFIVLNSDLDEFSRKIVLAHELGHAVLHNSKDINLMKDYYLLPKNSRLEKEANSFAAELLFNEEDEEYFYKYKVDIKILKELSSLKCKK